MPAALIDAIAMYLLARAPYDPDARGLYNSLIVAVSKAAPEADDVGRGDPAE